MKVLLCEDIEKLGYLGDVVEVKDGYARNFLLPYGKATVPSQGNIKSLALEKAKRANERKLVFEQLVIAAKAVEGAEVVIAANANEQGHLFGSVAERDIAQNLRDQGFEVADRTVKIDHHIKEVGQYPVTIRFAPELTATVTVTVVSQDAQDEQETSEDTEEKQDDKE